MKEKNSSLGSKKVGRPKKIPGFPSRRRIYQQAAGHAPYLVNRLIELTKSKNEPVAVSATKTLLDRILPVLKATQYSSSGEKPLGVIVLPQLNEGREKKVP